MHGHLQTRSWNGTAIPRRTSDGYINATAMAKASGKQWNNYFKPIALPPTWRLCQETWESR